MSASKSCTTDKPTYQPSSTSEVKDANQLDQAGNPSVLARIVAQQTDQQRAYPHQFHLSRPFHQRAQTSLQLNRHVRIYHGQRFLC